MKVLISYPRSGEKEGRQIAQALQQQGAEVSIYLNSNFNQNTLSDDFQENDQEITVVLHPQMQPDGSEMTKPAELDVIAEVREFIQQEMQFMENADNVDVACEVMLQHCLQFKHARYPAMMAIIHYLKNICHSSGDKNYYTEYKDQEELCKPWFPEC